MTRSKPREQRPSPLIRTRKGWTRNRMDAGLCRECHARRCQNCSNVDCSCAHPFAAVARAIVELDVSAHRTWRVLGQAGVTPKKGLASRTPSALLGLSGSDPN